MVAPDAKIGLEALFRDANFQKGISNYMSSIANATKKTDAGASAMNRAWGKTSQGIKGTDTASLALAGTLGGVVGGAISGLVSTILPRLIDKVGEALNLIKSFGSESILTAARVDELGLSAKLLGMRAGYTEKEVEDEIASIKELGIRTDVANKLVAQFSRYQLDMAKSTDIARLAQDAAILSGKDSSDTLDDILYGIITYNKRILRTSGLNVDLAGSFEDAADSMGIAKGDLEESEKVAAALNAVLEEGAKVAGLYEVAMELPGKRLRSVKRDVIELQTALGAPFQDAFGTFVDLIRSSLKTITTAVSEGGRLYKTIRWIGAAAAVAAEGISAFATKGLDAFLDFTHESSRSISELIWNAFEWGVELVTEFAFGIIKGAAWALTKALNFVGGILSWFLAPGSPPRIAPNIDKWGRGTMNEYLKGFTEADFGILKSLQSPIESALRIMSDLGEITREDFGRIFAELSVDMAKAISEFGKTGIVDETIFDRIMSATGRFGDSIVSLYKAQLDLAAATKEVRVQENALENARRRRVRAQDEINQLTKEYNDMLRKGAGGGLLKTQQDRINAAVEQRELAREEEKVAERNLDVAKQTADAYKEQVGLQESLVDQLIRLSKAQIFAPDKEDETEEEREARVVPFVDVDVDSITGRMDSAFEDMKQRIRDKLSDLFTPIVERWEEDVKPALKELEDAWEKFTQKVKDLWDKYVAPVVEKLKKFIPDNIAEDIWTVIGAILTFIGILITLQVTVAVASAIIGLLTNPIVLLIALLTLLWLAWENNWGGIRDKTVEVILFILGFLGYLLRKIDELEVTLHLMKIFFDWAWESIKVGVRSAITTIIRNIQNLIYWLQRMALPDWMTPGSPTPFELGLRGIRKEMAMLANIELPRLSHQLDTSLMRSGASPLGVPAGGMGSSNTYHLGGNTINNLMDSKTFEARVLQITRRDAG